MPAIEEAAHRWISHFLLSFPLADWAAAQQRPVRTEGQALPRCLCSWQGLLATAAQKWKSLLPCWRLRRRIKHLPSELLQPLSLLQGMISPATLRLLSLFPLEREGTEKMTTSLLLTHFSWMSPFLCNTIQRAHPGAESTTCTLPYTLPITSSKADWRWQSHTGSLNSKLEETVCLAWKRIISRG